MAVPCDVQAGQYNVRGISLGGVQTCLQIPQLSLLFDVGHCPRSFSATNNLFLTHGHGDHSGGLIGMLSLRLLHGIKKPLMVYAPKYMVDGLKAAVEAYESFQDFPYRWVLNPVGPGDEIPLQKTVVMRPFDSDHVIETQGYTAWETVDKLRDEYKTLPGAEIGRLRHEGADIFDRIERPLVTFPGDTRLAVVDRHPHLLESRVLILEATYLDEQRTVAQCHQFGHVHLDEIIERAADFKNEHLVLTHFSQSYPPHEVQRIIDKRLRPHVTCKVHALTPTDGVWPG
jgi:ribonuclease Z